MERSTRRGTRRALVCEGLEGRMVLSTAGVTPPMGLSMIGMHGPWDAGGKGAGAWAGHDAHMHGGKGPGMFNPANLSPQAQADFQKLQADMKAIQAKSSVTPAEEQAVRQDFQQIAQYLPRPGTTTPGQGHDHGPHGAGLDFGFGPGFGLGKNGTPADPSQIAADLTARLQKDNVPQSLIDKTVADVQAVAAASNVNATDMQTIAADRQALANDLGHKL